MDGIEELYLLYGRQQGEITVLKNMCAALMSLHPRRELLKQVVKHAPSFRDPPPSERSAEQRAFANGMDAAMATFRAVLASAENPQKKDKH